MFKMKAAYINGNCMSCHVPNYCTESYSLEIW